MAAHAKTSVTASMKKVGNLNEVRVNFYMSHLQQYTKKLKFLPCKLILVQFH